MGKENYQYKNLIENIPTAFAYHKVIYNEDNKPIDYLFLKVNNKFEELTGLKREEVINNKATDVLDNITNDPFDWIRFYGEVALTGKSVKFEEYSEPLGRWYQVKAYSNENGYFTTIFNEITERKLKEKELKEKNERLNNIFNNSNDIIWSMTWPDLQVQFISNSSKDIVGYSVEEFKEDPVLIQKITHPEDKSINIKYLTEIQKEGYAEREFRVICKDGSIRWMYDKSKMIYDENNRPIRIEGVMHDLTRRKKSENDLKKENLLFDSILESVQEGISVLNPDLTIRYINSTLEKWYKDKLPLKGKKCYEGYYDRDSYCDNCSVLESLESGQMESQIKELSDEFELDFIEIFSYPIWDEDKESITGVVEFKRDISEREKQRKDLEMMNFSVNNSNLLIFRVSPEGIIEYVNEIVLDKLGYEKGELIGKNVKKVLNTVNYLDRENFWEKLKKSTTITYERKYISKDEKEFPVEITSQYFKYRDKEYEFVFSQDITERKLQEEKIKNQRERMKYILEGTEAGTWEWNVQTGKTIFNGKWAEIIGYTLDEISPITVETWKNHTYPKDFEKSKKKLEKHFNGEIDQYKNELRMKHKNGHWVWVLDQGKVISWTDDGKPFKMFGIHLDITDRKKKEEKLRNNKDLLSSILEVQNNLVVVLNKEGKIIKFNKSCEKLTGYTFEEVRNKKVWEILIKKDEIEETKEVYRNLKAKNFPNEHENYWITKTKELKLISWSNNVILDQNNEVKYIVATGDDITDKIWGEKILKKSQQIANVGNWVYDIKNNILFWSDEIYRIFGMNPQEFETSYEAFLNVIHPDDREKVDNAYNTSIENNEEFYEIEHRIIKHDNGQIRYVKEKCEHIKNDDDEIIRSLGIVQDITDHIEKEKEIKYLLYKDKLTDLYNRRFFEEEIKRLDTKRNLPISIIMVDVNGLKIINDSYGHETGDQMLIETGKILKQELRDEDILARHGGDEFTVLLPQTSKKEAKKIISRLKAKNNKLSERSITVSFSLGVATKANEDENIRNILKKADDEMYRNKLSESKSTKNKIVQNLLNTLQAKSSETKDHAVRMTRLSNSLGEKLKLSNSELNRLSLLATLHDIGKTTISEDLLTKPGKLTEKEWEIIKEHPTSGYKIASASEEFILVAEEILYHHEHWNGNGYPDGLKGEEIPYLARIISIIDAYDVMTNKRPYSKAISKKEALYEIKRHAGKQFDPKLAKEFIELQEEK